jgi:hypothetical protein
MRFQIKAAQHIGGMGAEFAPLDGVTPKLIQRANPRARAEFEKLAAEIGASPRLLTFTAQAADGGV